MARNKSSVALIWEVPPWEALLRAVTDSENGNTLNPVILRLSALLKIRNFDRAEYIYNMTSPGLFL